MFTSFVVLTTLLFNKIVNSAQCPGELHGTPYPSQDDTIPPLNEYIQALQMLDIKAVFDDIRLLIHDSQECWPADIINGNQSYGGLFARLSWHCSGSYRQTDGSGGCGGGRQRYNPEASWPDNVNLDKARGLLWPIKQKYGNSLSWGDLFIFAGTAAVLDMGGPISSVCGGRFDDRNGSKSLILNETCPNQGNCPKPWGTSTVGLIYVNPQGVNNIPNPEPSAPRIRDIFGRMGFNDYQTVALIGGGHAFGKSHGACNLTNAAGLPPIDDPTDPWHGKCPNGTYGAGFEGPWTTHAFRWDNAFFKQLVNDKYEKIMGPGGHYQWRNTNNGNMMLTTDYSLIFDTNYKKIVTEFANNITLLNEWFAPSWKMLTESGGNWVPLKYRVCVEPEDLV